jgi:hypothetical protein
MPLGDRMASALAARPGKKPLTKLLDTAFMAIHD